MQDKNKYIVVTGDKNPKISQILNDCLTDLCVPTYKGESLADILKKICSKIHKSKATCIEAGDNIVITGTGDCETDPYIINADITHVHGIANSAGVQQFTFGIDENVRFEGQGGTTISFSPGSKKVIISSTSVVEETDPIAMAALITINEGTAIDITGTPGQTLSDPPVWTINHADTSSIADTTFTGAEVPDTITFDDLGHPQTLSKRILTLADLGYTPIDVNGQNAIHEVSSNVFEWGFNPLLHDTVITHAGFKVTYTGARNGNLVEVFNTDTNPSAVGLFAQSPVLAVYGQGSGSTGIGVLGLTSGNLGVSGSASGSGTGVQGTSSTGKGGVFTIVTPNGVADNTFREIVELNRSTLGTPGNGLGGYLSWKGTVSTLTSQEMGRAGFLWTDVTNATRSSRFELYTVNSATLARKLAINPNGSFVMDTYGDGIHTGILTYVAGWDSNGNVIEIDPGTFGGGGGGLTNAYVNMTDGTNTSGASGGDTFKFRSANSLLTVLVTNDEAVHNDNLLLTVDPQQIRELFSAGDGLSYDNLTGEFVNTEIDKNFAEDDLIVTGNRIHDFDGFTMTFTNARSFTVENIDGSDQYAFINKGQFDVSIGNIHVPLSKVAVLASTIESGVYQAMLFAGTATTFNKILVKENGIDILPSGLSQPLKITNLPTGSESDDILVINPTTFRVSRLPATAFDETDPIANSKTIFLNEGPGITITGATGQTVGSNPSWTISCDITQYTDEMAQDAVFNNITAHNALTGAYNDIANTYDIKVGGDLDEDTNINLLGNYWKFNGLGGNYFYIDDTSIDFYSENGFDVYKYAYISAYTADAAAGAQLLVQTGSNSVGIQAIYTATEHKVTIVATDTGQLYIETLVEGGTEEDVVVIGTDCQVKKIPRPTFFADYRIGEREFKVGADGSLVDNGETTFILLDCSGNPATNKKVVFFRERMRQYHGDDYTYNSSTGEIVLTYAAVTGQRFNFTFTSSAIWDSCINNTFGDDFLLIDDTDALLVDDTDQTLI